MEDFLKRCASIVNKKSLESLIKVGALDAFGDRKILLENVQNLIDWTKNIANADFGLFGGMGVDTSIQLKMTEKATHMEKLMMEQEVLKAFVSGHPLDGLYLYIKKFSFLNQVLEQHEVPKFIIIGYIKEVQRAKKKGFFIKIEDISASWEFFIKDALDFQKFDLVVIYGAKIFQESRGEGRIFLDKIIKTDYPTLMKLAGGKFDPEWTVARAKKERYGDQKKQEIEKIKAEKPANPVATPKLTAEEENEIPAAEELFVEEALQEESFSEAEFPEEEFDSALEEPILSEAKPETEEVFTLTKLPDDLEKIQLLAEILKQELGEIPVLILGNEYQVSEKGLERLKLNFHS